MASSHGDEGPPASSMAASASMVATPMASRHEDCERLKDILKEENSTTLAVVEASSKNSKDTEADPMIMDPRLLMAARRGDCKALENVLINHQVRPNDLKTEPSFVIHMPEGGSRTQEIEEGTDQHSQKATGKTYLLYILNHNMHLEVHMVSYGGFVQVHIYVWPFYLLGPVWILKAKLLPYLLTPILKNLIVY